MLRVNFMSTCCGIALRWGPENTFDDNSVLVQMRAWCFQATNHFLSLSDMTSVSILPHNYRLVKIMPIKRSIPCTVSWLHPRLRYSSCVRYLLWWDIVIDDYWNLFRSVKSPNTYMGFYSLRWEKSTHISQFWDFARSGGTTSYHLVERGPGYGLWSGCF